MKKDIFPVLTWLLIVANVTVFVIGIFFLNTTQFFASFAFRPELFLQGDWYRLVTGGFLHTGLPHLFWNLIFLYLFGRVAESIYGRLQTATIYFSGMVIGNLSVLLLPIHAQVVGASGAVFGLIGSTILLEPMRPVMEDIPVPISLIGAAYILPSAFNAFNIGSGIAHIAHVSGAVIGAGVAFITDREEAWKGLVAVVAFTALILAIAFF